MGLPCPFRPVNPTVSIPGAKDRKGIFLPDCVNAALLSNTSPCQRNISALEVTQVPQQKLPNYIWTSQACDCRALSPQRSCLSCPQALAWPPNVAPGILLWGNDNGSLVPSYYNPVVSLRFLMAFFSKPVVQRQCPWALDRQVRKRKTSAREGKF